MRKYLPFLVVFIFLSGLLIQPVEAQPLEARRGGNPVGGECAPGSGYGFKRWSKEDLNLSKEQEKKLQSLELNFEKEITKLSSEIRIKQLELRELWSADTPDESKINTKIEEIGKLQTEIEKKRTSHLLEVKKVLTEEQWLKLRSKPGFCGKMPAGPEPRKKQH